MRPIALFALLHITAWGCAPSIVVPTPPESPSESSISTKVPPAARAPEQAFAEPVLADAPSSDDASIIHRHRLEEVLDKGPGAFLATVQVKAAFHGKQFRGWQVAAMSAPSDNIATVQVGDIVHRVNNYSLRTPSDLERLWKSLWTANAMVVVVERAGQRVNLRYDITNDTKDNIKD